MNWKIVSAFVSGALIASGIVYLAVKPEPSAKAPVDAPKPVAALERPAPPAPLAEPEPAPAPAARIAPARERAARPIIAVRPHFHEKPSPMPPALPREQIGTVARNVSVPPIEPATTPPQPVPESPAAVEPPPAPAQVPAAPLTPAVSVATSEVRTPNHVVLAAGTKLAVRIGETISSARNQVGDSFLATLEQQLVIDGWIIAERGARMEGRVLDAKLAGRAGGTSYLEVVLVKLATADGQNVRIRTEAYKKDGTSSTGGDVAKVGAGTVLGAAIGAIAGGGKGAAIGAGAGAGAGGGAVLLSRGKSVEIPVETRLSFRVLEPVTITEKLD